MIEHYGRIIVVNGEVLPVEDYYDGIDETEDGAVIDKIISGVDRHDNHSHGDAKALAQGVLGLLGKESSADAVRRSIEQHPSAQNETEESVGAVAAGIMRDYAAEVERLRRLKKVVDVSSAKRGVFIAIIRNLEQLGEHDLEQLSEMMGYDKDHFQPKVSSDLDNDAKEWDWRERQYKD